MKIKDNLKNDNGFAIAMVLVTFMVVSILGLAILPLATSEHRLTKNNSRYQSTYYIAESGVHYMLSEIQQKVDEYVKEEPTVEGFFSDFESEFLKSHEFKEFQENFGDQPVADIKVELDATSENTRDYKIESIGKIGDSSRTVSSKISIEYREPVEATPGESDIFNSFLLTNGNFNAIEQGGFKVNGNLYIGGDYEIHNSTEINGDIHVGGVLNVPNSFNNNGKIDGSIYVYEDTILETSGQDHSLSIIEEERPFPKWSMTLRDDSWYESNGYEVKGNVTNEPIADGEKWLVESYDDTNVNGRRNLTNVFLLSKGDINITMINNFSGALIAPNGSITIDKVNKFTGLIIARDGIKFLGGGIEFTVKTLEEYFHSTENYPVLINDSEIKPGSPAQAAIYIKSSIKEL